MKRPFMILIMLLVTTLAGVLICANLTDAFSRSPNSANSYSTANPGTPTVTSSGCGSTSQSVTQRAKSKTRQQVCRDSCSASCASDPAGVDRRFFVYNNVRRVAGHNSGQRWEV